MEKYFSRTDYKILVFKIVFLFVLFSILFYEVSSKYRNLHVLVVYILFDRSEVKMDKHDHLPLKVGQLAEAKSFLQGFRGAWFRCKVSILCSSTK